MMKDHQIAQLINDLRDVANEYAGTDQLREVIAAIILPVFSSQQVQGDCDHDWEDVGGRLECTYPECGATKAMPIQNDKWVTITNEEWNIPKLGQRVIVCINGVVQNVPVKLDCTDPDIGLSKYYWDHKDFDESPFVKAGDSWMPWPTKPQSEVKPSC